LFHHAYGQNRGFLYPGNQHYFADASLPSHDKAAPALLMERVLSFLDGR